jgi:hypothetical protein
MLTRATRYLDITPPPTRSERTALEQHAAARAAGDTDTADKLAATLTVTRTRITVACLNTLQYGRYEANRRQVAPWAKERGGGTVDDLIATEAGAVLIEAGLRWARANAAVTAVETYTANRVTDAASDWQATDWPQLGSIDAFADEVPGDLVEALDALIFDLNPGLFRYGEGDADAKKNGGISVG